MLAHDPSTPAELRLAAAERAASLNIIDGEDLARAYREAAPALPKTAQSASGAAGAAVRRLRKRAVGQDPRRVRSHALLASARDQDIEVPIAEALAKASAGLVQDPQAAAFAETGIRVAALAGDERERLGLGRCRRRARARVGSFCLPRADPLRARAPQAALAEGVDLALKGGLPAAVAAPPRHRARRA